jgi:uncharacterized protein YbaR (Trm112 family)
MIDPEFVKMLRCPATGSPLGIADESLIDDLNHAIRRGDAYDRIDQPVKQPLDGGLCSGSWLYPIRDHIPTLIADEAIAIADFANSTT